MSADPGSPVIEAVVALGKQTVRGADGTTGSILVAGEIRTEAASDEWVRVF
jgi:hypothetical protein